LRGFAYFTDLIGRIKSDEATTQMIAAMNMAA
jgi:hypothetical protein